MKTIFLTLIAMPSVLMASSYPGWYDTISDLVAANPGKSGVVYQYSAGEQDPQGYLDGLYSFSEEIEAFYAAFGEFCMIGDITKVKIKEDAGVVTSTIPPTLATYAAKDIQFDLKNQTMSYTMQSESRYFMKDKVTKRPFKVSKFPRKTVSKCQY